MAELVYLPAHRKRSSAPGTRSMRDVLSERLAVVAKAAARYRHLAAARPDRYRARQARILELLANRLSEAHDWDEALAAMRASVAVTRTLATSDARFVPALASRLMALAAACYAAGDVGSAISSCGEAADIHRRSGNDEALVGALRQLSRGLAVTGDAHGALAVIREATAAHRRVTTGQQGSDGTASGAAGLAWTLGLLGMRLRLAGDSEGARAATAEAIALLEHAPHEAGSAPVLAYLRKELETLSRRSSA